MNKGLRLLLTGLLGLAAGLAAAVAAAVPAHACSCAQATDPEQLDRADVVFTGRLLGRQDAPPAADGSVSSGDLATLTFAVDRVYKGAVAARQPVLTVRSGASCGWELAGEGPYVVFAQREVDGLRTDLCSGNRTGSAPAAWGSGTSPAPVAPSPSPASGTPSTEVAASGRAVAPRTAATADGFWDVGAPGVAIAAGLVLVAGLLNLPRAPRDE
jgi:hypothetical protein